MQPFILEGAGLRLDQPVEADIAAIAEHCQDPIFEHYVTTPWPYSLSDAKYFVEQLVPTGWRNGREFTWECVVGNVAGAPEQTAEWPDTTASTPRKSLA